MAQETNTMTELKFKSEAMQDRMKCSATGKPLVAGALYSRNFSSFSWTAYSPVRPPITVMLLEFGITYAYGTDNTVSIDCVCRCLSQDSRVISCHNWDLHEL